MIRKISLYCSSLFLVLWISACDFDSEGDSGSPGRAVCDVVLRGNYTAFATALDTNLFDSASTSSYSFTVFAQFRDVFDLIHRIDLYFVKTDDAAHIWDVYVYIDNIAANIVEGSMGSQRQTKARLIFDDDGALVQVLPENILVRNLRLSFSTFIHDVNISFPTESNTHLFMDTDVAADDIVCNQI